MSKNLCHYCNADLQDWNTGAAPIKYCPNCGKKLYKAVVEAVWNLCLDVEIADMIKRQVINTLDNYDPLDAGDLAFTAWENENVNGVVFCSNYDADCFAIRHRDWVNEALAHLIDDFGEEGKYAEVMAECMDRFLVVAFIEATKYYLYVQLEIDNNEGCLTDERKEEIRRLVEETVYDGQF